MPTADSAARGVALLRERIARTPEQLAQMPARAEALMTWAKSLPRCLVTTGIGTSEGHARHMAAVAARCCGQPARFTSTGALAEGPPPDSHLDWLVVFSQGLSANARFAFTGLEAWGGVILVTAADPTMTVEEGLGDEKRALLETLEAKGVLRVDLGCGLEYGALVRVMGARAGYKAGWSVLRALAARRLSDEMPISVDDRALMAAQVAAPQSARGAFPEDALVSPFFDAERAILIVAEGGALEWADQLALKISEALLRPRPHAVDVLEFAHGPLQSLALRPTSILYLASPTPAPYDWSSRFAATLDPRLHDLRVLTSTLEWPFAAIEYEAIMDAIVLRALEESAANIVDWPGADREKALYAVGPRPEELERTVADVGTAASDPARSRQTFGGALHGRDYESRVWPEVEALVREGRRTALIGLGSIEQHGPHLPLGTDRWIADALLEGLAARVPDAIAIPAIAIGCASEHLDFSGTLHVEPETLEAMLRDLLRSLTHHGFERAFLFTAHGGNVDALAAMRERLATAVAPLDLRIEIDLKVGAMQAAVVASESLSAESAGPHAGEYETSLVAWLRPGAIRVDALAEGRCVAPGEAQGLFYPSLRPNSESGVLGDPSAAQADRGGPYLEAWLDLLEGAYQAAFSPEAPPTASR